jgi:hypothetical protein
VGTILPGAGSIYISQTLSFHFPVRIGDDSLTSLVLEQPQAQASTSAAQVVRLARRVFGDAPALNALVEPGEESERDLCDDSFEHFI